MPNAFPVMVVTIPSSNPSSREVDVAVVVMIMTMTVPAVSECLNWGNERNSGEECEKCGFHDLVSVVDYKFFCVLEVFIVNMGVAQIQR